MYKTITCPHCKSTREKKIDNCTRVLKVDFQSCRSCSVKAARRHTKWGATHGQTKTPLYQVWSAMKCRCTNLNDQSASRYIGRGITLFTEWREYVSFREWALSNGYEKGKILDRIDNDGNYTPENCRWTDSFTSGENRSNVKFNRYDAAAVYDLIRCGSSIRTIAALYALDPRRVSDIKNWKKWKGAIGLLV